LFIIAFDMKNNLRMLGSIEEILNLGAINTIFYQKND
jgi:hypothetical protein